MAGFRNDVVFAQKGLRIGAQTIPGPQQASIEFDASGSDVALLINNTSADGGSDALNEVQVVNNNSDPYFKTRTADLASWCWGNLNSSGNQPLIIGFRADGSCSPQTNTNVPIRFNVGNVGANRGQAIVRSTFAVASEGEASGSTVRIHGQNVETAAGSDVEFLLQTANPAFGGGRTSIRWGTLGQIQFSLGQGKDLTASTQVLAFQEGGFVSGAASLMEFHSGGSITKPQQPAFFGKLNSADSDVTGAGTGYNMGTDVALTEVFDQNSDFNTNGTFTAPVTGKYLLLSFWRFSSVTAAMVAGQFSISTSNQDFVTNLSNPGAIRSGAPAADFINNSQTVFADMDAGDTAVRGLIIWGAAGDTVDLNIDMTSFSGVLIA